VINELKANDRGFTLGDGLFETIAVRNAQPLHLQHHLHRLRMGLNILRFEFETSDARITAAIHTTIESHRMTDAVVRLTLTRGPAPRGVLPSAASRPNMLITVSPWNVIPDTVRVILAQTTRRNEASPLSRIKSLNYLDSVLARMEAADAGADDAILLNTRDHLAEASAANLFVLLQGQWFTPPVHDGALPGIARALLIERAGVAERSLTPNDLLQAEAAFLSNSLGLREILCVDDRKLISRQPDRIDEFRQILR
jgi:branched-chain amino acid aminotransferase